MKRAGIALGSNLGDKNSLMVQARDHLLQMSLSDDPFLQSSLYATSPQGCPHGADDYLNAVVEFTWPGKFHHGIQIIIRTVRTSLRTGGIQGGLQKRVIRQAHLQQMIPGLNHQAVFIPKIGPQCNACSLHQQKTLWPFRKRRTATMPKKL